MFDRNVHKIIFTGPVGAGKSTAINSVSDIPVVSTEEMATDNVKERKQTTTVAMDYGMIKLNDGQNIHLYGTPGQERFSFMWDILVENAIGVVVLVDNANEDPLGDLNYFLKSFQRFISNKALVVGITRTDLGSGPKFSEYHRVLNSFKFNPPVFEVDGRKPGDISLLLQALLFNIDQTLEEIPLDYAL